MQLHHGDCLAILPTIPNASADAIITDLPYGTTRNAWDSIIPLPELWIEYRRVAKPNAPIILTAQQPFTSMLVASNLKDFRYELVWEKNLATGFLNARKMPLKAHESVLVFYSSLPTYNPQMTAGEPYVRKQRADRLGTNYGKINDETVTRNDGDRYPRSVLRFPVERGLHCTQKPVSLMRYLIATFTHPGDVVLDSCMGSGSTGVAAIQTGREFIGIERDDAYFAAASLRLNATLTGVPAKK